MINPLVEQLAKVICGAVDKRPNGLICIYDPPLELRDPDYEAKSKKYKSIPVWRQEKYLAAAHAVIDVMRAEP